MATTLRNLGDFVAFKHGLEAICDTCDGRWGVDVRRAVRVLGGRARPDDLVGKLKCPHCDEGRCATTDPIVDGKPVTRPIYFPGTVDDFNGGEL